MKFCWEALACLHQKVNHQYIFPELACTGVTCVAFVLNSTEVNQNTDKEWNDEKYMNKVF